MFILCDFSQHLKREALCIGGLVPVKELYSVPSLLQAEPPAPPSMDDSVAENLPSVDESVALPSMEKSVAETPLSQLEMMKLGERIFPILQRHFPNSEFTGKATGMILEELDNKKIEKKLIENEQVLVNHANKLIEFLKNYPCFK